MSKPTATEKIIYQTTTPFQEIKLSRLSDGEVALYLDDAIQFVSGYDDRVYHGVLASYPARMLDGHGSALILGGGDGLAARNLLKDPNIEKVVMVELDPGVIEFASTDPIMVHLNEGAFQNKKLKVRTEDAREYLGRSPKERFDIVIVDFPDPLDENLETLYSEDLYRKMKNHATERPIYAVQSSSAFGDVEDEVAETLCRATGSFTVPVRFRGERMADGTIIFAGKGLKPAMLALPPEYIAPFEDDIAGSGGGDVF